MGEGAHSSNNLLITGGAGFIGSALVREAMARGYRVHVLDKLTYAGHRMNLEGLDCALTVGDVTDAALLGALFAREDFSGVLHAAAESHVDQSIRAGEAFVRTNVQGTQALLDAARHAWAGDPARRFLQVSTDEVYGALGPQGVFTPASPLAPNSPYAASKAAADLLVRAWSRTYGLNTVITRCCNNYGPRQHPEKLIPRMLTQALSGAPLPVYGDGQQRREWIHVEDHARGVLQAFERAEPSAIVHLGSGVEAVNLDLVQRLCALLAARKPGVEYAARITHVPDRPGHDFRYALDDAGAAAIGFAPRITFEAGLAATVDWYLAHPDWIATMQQWRGA